MALYSLRSPNTVTKFDSDGNVESVYTCDGYTCDCPAGPRPTCRHRQMYSDLRSIRDTHWFLDWDHGRTIVDFSGIPRAHYDALILRQEETNCPKCGAQVDERFDCCEVHNLTAKDTTPPRPPWRRI